MAEYLRPGTSIRCFDPDDTDTVKYVRSDSDYSLGDLIDLIKDKFGDDVNLDHVQITAEHIHTDCLGYGSYDSGDHTDFLVLTLVQPAPADPE